VLSSVPPRHAALGERPAVERCEAGDIRLSGTLALQILHPLAQDYERRLPTNAMSCVVRFQAGSVAVLLTGDIPSDRGAALAARTPTLPAQLLMAPHHGSRSSSSPALLDAVAPSRVFAQAGYRNRYGHPDPVVVDRYTAQGLVLSRTDHGGQLQWRFASDGSIEHTAARATAVRYWHNRPFAGQERPPTGTPDDNGFDEASREPLSGMP
jgi:competence protein ComEC